MPNDDNSKPRTFLVTGLDITGDGRPDIFVQQELTPEAAAALGIVVLVLVGLAVAGGIGYLIYALVHALCAFAVEASQAWSRQTWVMLGLGACAVVTSLLVYAVWRRVTYALLTLGATGLLAAVAWGVYWCVVQIAGWSQDTWVWTGAGVAAAASVTWGTIKITQSNADGSLHPTSSCPSRPEAGLDGTSPGKARARRAVRRKGTGGSGSPARHDDGTSAAVPRASVRRRAPTKGSDNDQSAIWEAVADFGKHRQQRSRPSP